MDFDPFTKTVSGGGKVPWQRFTMENGVARSFWSHDGVHWHEGEQAPDPAALPNRAARRRLRFKGA